MKFTDRFLNSVQLPDGKSREIHTDDGTGLRLRVTPTAKTFTCDYRLPGGKRKTRTIGRFPAVSLAAARQTARETISAAALGVDVMAVEERAATVGDVLAEYDRKHLHRLNTGAERLQCLKRELSQHLNAPIDTVTRRDLRAIVDAVATRASDARTNRVRAYMKALFRWAATDGDYIETDPAANLPRPTPEPPRDRVLSIDEVRQIYDAAEDWPAVRLLLLTAARRSEITDLTWREVNDGMIELAGSRTKNGKPHAIPLSPEAAAIIDAQPQGAPDDYVFDRRVLNRVKADLPELDEPWRLHDIRRAYGTWASENGTPIDVIELCLGHSISRLFGHIAGVYNRAQKLPERRRALENWGKAVTRQDADVVTLHA